MKHWITYYEKTVSPLPIGVCVLELAFPGDSKVTVLDARPVGPDVLFKFVVHTQSNISE